ncbi:response regulator [bacterium AH-315-F18]|nr:response regulator [bacterium AH-315-F18]
MKTLTVVEDNLDNLLLVRALLGKEYRLLTYEDGRAALEGLNEERPDLVLLDISLPGMDGNEVLKRIRANAALADLPVIALTAHAMNGDRDRFLSAGFDDYLTKPIIDADHFKSIIQNLICKAG